MRFLAYVNVGNRKKADADQLVFETMERSKGFFYGQNDRVLWIPVRGNEMNEAVKIEAITENDSLREDLLFLASVDKWLNS